MVNSGPMTKSPAPSSECEPISIMFAFNAEYAQHAAACIASLLRNSRSTLEVVIVSVDDPSRFESRIRRSFDWSSRIRFEFRQFAMPADMFFPTPYRLTVETYLRF